MIIVSNTTPLHYLILIGEQNLLPTLFGRVLIPPSVVIELQRPETPEAVRNWIGAIPSWLEVRSPSTIDQSLNLGAGEREAISLAQEMGADHILLDDKKARNAALARGLNVLGTLNILDDAAEQGLLDLPDAINRLRLTNFRVSETLLQEILRRDAARKAAGS